MNTAHPVDRADRMRGALLGTALGDALGLPFEGLSAATIARRRVRPTARFQLLGTTGYVSDDTEQSALVVEALLSARGDPTRAVTELRASLRGWFARLPFGIGWSTLKACVRLLFGATVTGSRSAGNGAAMRSAVVGVFFADDAPRRRSVAAELARITHLDDRAIEAAVFVAELAALCASDDGATPKEELVARAATLVQAPELSDAIARARALHAGGSDLPHAALQLGNTGFAVHTLGLVTYCFLSAASAIDAIALAIDAGGDTDTAASIVGALFGALHGECGLPGELVAKLDDGPFGRAHLRLLCSAVAQGCEPPAWSRLHALTRNLSLYPVVLAHGLARLMPRG